MLELPEEQISQDKGGRTFARRPQGDMALARKESH